LSSRHVATTWNRNRTNIGDMRNDCRQEAARALDKRDVEGFLKIADHWLKMARKVAKESEGEAAN
jgi:hypothetical protein